MTAAAAIYQRMGMDKLREQAATEGEGQDEAARHFVNRLLDLEVERRMLHLHERPGWHNCSPGFGDGTGASTAPSDAMYMAYIKGIRLGGWHERAGRTIGKLPERRRFAVLLQAAKSDSRLNGPLAAKYDDIAKHIGYAAQYLGWPPGVQALAWFRNGQAIKRQALEARAELLMLAKVGLV